MDPEAPEAAAVAAAATALRAGSLVAFPTDTLYALAADPFRPGALDRVFAAKGRHPAKALSLLVADVPMAVPLTAGLPRSARALMEAFWPGPLTLILPPAHGLPSALVPPGGGIGLRAPRAPVALAVLRALGGPLVGTSANRAGGPDPVEAATVLREVGRHLRLLLDAGPTAVGVASTVLDCTTEPPRLLRLGAVPPAALQAVLPDAGLWWCRPDPRKW